MRTAVFALLLVSAAAVLAGPTVTDVAATGFLCDLCKDFVQSVKDELQRDEPKLIEKMNAWCDKITKKNPIVDPLCKSLIDKEIIQIIDKLEKEKSKEEICIDLKLCKA